MRSCSLIQSVLALQLLWVSPVLPWTKAAVLSAQALPPVPDPTGFGTHVLAVARDPRGTVWVGTYGQGIFRLRPGGSAWEQLRRDSTGTSISWDFVHAFAFGSRGQIWYGTVGNGWGVSLDDGATWTNWTFNQLGPEWQYVAPDGIVIRGDTVWVATADGLQMTADDGAHWVALGDAAGPLAKGPADTAFALLTSEYVRRIGFDRQGVIISGLRGNERLIVSTTARRREDVAFPRFAPKNQVLLGGRSWRGSSCGLRMAADTTPCFKRAPAAAGTPQFPRTTWFRRPIDRADNGFIDQTYRYGSTMGGNFQQHQGVEFNNPDGTPVLAIGAGRVVYAGRAEQGALTVAIRHDTTVAGADGPLRVFSVYYHNSEIDVRVGERVATGQRIARVGNTGRATNDHLHLEVHAVPGDNVSLVVDSLQRYPAYTTNPELWIDPLPLTGIVAGQVFDASGVPIPQARVYGLVKPDPAETPFSFAETYGDRAHPHPLYGEHFAVSDLPPGSYVLATEIAGRKVFRRVTVEEGKLTWVVFRP